MDYRNRVIKKIADRVEKELYNYGGYFTEFDMGNLTHAVLYASFTQGESVVNVSFDYQGKRELEYEFSVTVYNGNGVVLDNLSDAVETMVLRRVDMQILRDDIEEHFLCDYDEWNTHGFADMADFVEWMR